MKITTQYNIMRNMNKKVRSLDLSFLMVFLRLSTCAMMVFILNRKIILYIYLYSQNIVLFTFRFKLI